MILLPDMIPNIKAAIDNKQTVIFSNTRPKSGILFESKLDFRMVMLAKRHKTKHIIIYKGNLYQFAYQPTTEKD